MAWIKTYETKDRRRGKSVKTYRVMWKETDREERGLPLPASQAKQEGAKAQYQPTAHVRDCEAAQQFRDELNAAKHQPGAVLVPRD